MVLYYQPRPVLHRINGALAIRNVLNQVAQEEQFFMIEN